MVRGAIKDTAVLSAEAGERSAMPLRWRRNTFASPRWDVAVDTAQSPETFYVCKSHTVHTGMSLPNSSSNSKSLTVRRADIKEASGIASFTRDMACALGRNWEELVQDTCSFDLIAEEITDNETQIWLAEQSTDTSSSDVIGFAKIQNYVPPIYPRLTKPRIHLESKSPVELELLMVRPDQQRRDVGTILLDTAEQAARSSGRGGIVLTVWESSEAARSMYLNRGYTQRGNVEEVDDEGQTVVTLILEKKFSFSGAFSYFGPVPTLGTYSSGVIECMNRSLPFSEQM